MDENNKQKDTPAEETPDVSFIQNPDVAHEKSDINVSATLKFTAALAVLLLVTLGLMRFLYGFLGDVEREQDPPPTSLVRPGSGEQLPPEPRLQGAPGSNVPLGSPWAEWEKVKQEQTDLLNSYGWVDQNAGRVRIPIEEAKRLALQRGFPVAAPAPGQAQAGQADDADLWNMMPSDASAGRALERR